MCGSDEWRQAMREVILRWALGDADLGEDVLGVGPGSGACTDVLSKAVPRLTSVEIDDELAAHHTDDTYDPVDPESLPARLAAAGFIDVEVRTNA
jgi:protein-L-isoaspartate O-methyltransferase